ncbi:cell wall-binding repeat-containing protein [Bacillus salacetis]|uniref:cell wall-binding repeat-containing protein n=1 Tax=Bacillus salacetis TaxID=2315464 RepID=UPI003BA1DD3D
MKRILAYSIVTLLALSAMVFPNKAEATSEYYRISGDNRIDTAVEISGTGWDSSNIAILARADNPADALAAASLSGRYSAPILLTYKDRLPDSVLWELNRLDVGKVYVLGGTSAIQSNVEKELRDNDFIVKRISGDTRFQTAANINIEARLNTGTKAIVANGYTVADALSASSTAAIDGVPIYLTNKTNLPVDLPSSIKEVTIYGGETVVGKEVSDYLTKKGIKVTRIAGANRYDTNIQSLNASRADDIIMVRGTSVSTEKEDYPDAVTASGLAKVLNANIILTHPTKVVPEVEEFFSYSRFINIYVLGGEMAVSSDVVYGSSAFYDTDVPYFFEEEVVDAVVHPTEPIIYYTTEFDPDIWMLNYETGESETLTFSFEEQPESLYFHDGSLYATLVKGEHSPYWWTEDQEGAIAIIDAASFEVTKQFDTKLDPFDIVVDKNGYIYISSGSGQWTNIKSYDETGAEIRSSYPYNSIRNQSYIEYDPAHNLIYAIDTDVSPRDIAVYTPSNTGELVGYHESPYHGDYDLGDFGHMTGIKVSPDGRYVFNSGGHVFNGETLGYKAGLDREYTDVVFDETDNQFMLGQNGIIVTYDFSSFKPNWALSTYGTIEKMMQNEDAIVILSKGYFEGYDAPMYSLELLHKSSNQQQPGSVSTAGHSKPADAASAPQ